MKKIIGTTLAVFLLTYSVFVSSAQTSEQVIALVKETVSAIAENADETFSKINKAEHPFKNKDNPALYVFVFDTDLNVVAHAVKAKAVGKNVRGKPDSKGKKFRDEILEKAQKDGSGWVDYYFLNPKTKQEEHKNSYFELVAGSDGKEYIVGSGKYFDD